MRNMSVFMVTFKFGEISVSDQQKHIDSLCVHLSILPQWMHVNSSPSFSILLHTFVYFTLSCLYRFILPWPCAILFSCRWSSCWWVITLWAWMLWTTTFCAVLGMVGSAGYLWGFLLHFAKITNIENRKRNHVQLITWVNYNKLGKLEM